MEHGLHSRRVLAARCNGNDDRPTNDHTALPHTQMSWSIPRSELWKDGVLPKRTFQEPSSNRVGCKNIVFVYHKTGRSPGGVLERSEVAFMNINHRPFLGCVQLLVLLDNVYRTRTKIIGTIPAWHLAMVFAMDEYLKVCVSWRTERKWHGIRRDPVHDMM